MDPRLKLPQVAPDGYAAMLAFSTYAKTTALDARLRDLVYIRASQINGCAYCLDMHAKDAVAAGETAERLNAVAAWREAPYFTEQERAALAWTEAVTRLEQTHAPDADYEALKAHFDTKGIADLTLAIAAINSWNRLMVAFRAPAGHYKPKGTGSE